MRLANKLSWHLAHMIRAYLITSAPADIVQTGVLTEIHLQIPKRQHQMRYFIEAISILEIKIYPVPLRATDGISGTGDMGINILFS